VGEVHQSVARKPLLNLHSDLVGEADVNEEVA